MVVRIALPERVRETTLKHSLIVFHCSNGTVPSRSRRAAVDFETPHVRNGLSPYARGFAVALRGTPTFALAVTLA